MRVTKAGQCAEVCAATVSGSSWAFEIMTSMAPTSIQEMWSTLLISPVLTSCKVNTTQIRDVFSATSIGEGVKHTHMQNPHAYHLTTFCWKRLAAATRWPDAAKSIRAEAALKHAMILRPKMPAVQEDKKANDDNTEHNHEKQRQEKGRGNSKGMGERYGKWREKSKRREISKTQKQ